MITLFFQNLLLIHNNECIKCVEIKYGRCFHSIEIIFLHIDLNKNLTMQDAVKFHELSDYVLTFHKIHMFI